MAKRVLLSTDLSEESLRPFARLCEILESPELEVTLLYVLEDLPALAPAESLAPAMLGPRVAEGLEPFRQRLDELARMLVGRAHVRCEAISAGRAAEAIAEHARAGGYDLIALSSHGRSGFRRLLLGSVAEGVLRHARVPVLVFPPEHPGD